MGYEHIVVAAAGVVELVGVAVLLLGTLLAVLIFARRPVRGATFQDACRALRADLGRATLLRLELSAGTGGERALAMAATADGR